jgi:hypothetical protein
MADMQSHNIMALARRIWAFLLRAFLVIFLGVVLAFTLFSVYLLSYSILAGYIHLSLDLHIIILLSISVSAFSHLLVAYLHRDFIEDLIVSFLGIPGG